MRVCIYIYIYVVHVLHMYTRVHVYIYIYIYIQGYIPPFNNNPPSKDMTSGDKVNVFTRGGIIKGFLVNITRGY